jgi:hypothetical protein
LDHHQNSPIALGLADPTALDQCFDHLVLGHRDPQTAQAAPFAMALPALFLSSGHNPYGAC